jgi:hypothetical protein
MKKEFQKQDAIIQEENHLSKRARICLNEELMESLLRGQLYEEGREPMFGLSSDLLMSASALKSTKEKATWFQGAFCPVVGTSLILEVSPEDPPIVLKGKTHDQFNLKRKHCGPAPLLPETPLVNLNN